jgi:hypothetical protein
MSPLRAVLVFPARPASAVQALSPRTALAAPAPPLLLLLFLLARGCGEGDAAASAAGLLLLILGLGAGGTLTGALVRRLLPGTPRRALAVHVVFAAWTVVVFVVAAAVAAAAGLGAGAPLAAGFFALVWGVVVGTRILAEDAEAGRALVASCAGATGAVLGLLPAGLAVHTWLVMAVPAPDAAGAPVLVRREAEPVPGSLVLARDPASARLFFARVGPQGRLAATGASPPGPAASWAPLGRVFFRFDSSLRGDPPRP